MRFTEFGPSIPDVLLDGRDAGEVVFLCGAGISIPAGLPDFFDLTCAVAGKLGCPPDSLAGKLIAREVDRRKPGAEGDILEAASLDYIFSQLILDFGAAQVEAEVVEALRTPHSPDLQHHRALLDLARGPDSHRRLVTTNFDRLFQEADPQLHSYAPPRFPDLQRGDKFDGIVHLHGILPDPTAKPLDEVLGLVLSRRDFGRAYLAEAWATRFVRDLLARHIVVLLGYSADDLPVRYLLEGLEVSKQIGSPRLYAFVADGQSFSDRDWHGRGATPIVYDPVNQHRHLWESIHAWADRARDIGAWRSRIASLAQTPPERLKPFERGQVAALCRSEEGARGFAFQKPPPPPEWLCVLDAAYRYAKPGRSISYSENPAPEIDPLEIFGLDDDPPRPQAQDRFSAPPGIDLLGPLETDAPVAREQGIASGWRWPGALLNTRLFLLTRWIQSVMTSPTTVWWVAGRGLLHGHLRNQLSETLDRDDAVFDPIVRQAWRLVLEAHDSAPGNDRGGWHSVQRQISQESWTPRTIRAFAMVTRPRLTVLGAWDYAPIPPGTGEELTLARIGRFEVVYPAQIETSAEIPDASLAAILAVIRANLEHGAALENEISSCHRPLPPLHPDEKEGQHFRSDDEKYFFVFTELFKRLIAVDAKAARREFERWDETVRFFVPPRLFAFADARVTTPAEVGRALRAMSRESFWNPHLARDLLWMLRARWADLSNRDRLASEKKILQGPEKYPLESDEDYAEHRAINSAQRLVWMQDQGLALSAATVTTLPKLKSANPRWRDSWAKTADASLGSRVGYIKQETDAAPIADLPISEVIARCDALGARDPLSFIHHDPFRGLVKNDPQRALAVLDHEARQGNYPRRYWANLFSDWPGNASSAQDLMPLVRAGTALPGATIVELRHELTGWFETHYAEIDRHEREPAHLFFNRVVDALVGAGQDAMHSGMGKSRVHGVEIPSNLMGIDYAINAPTGHLAKGLLAALDARKIGAGQGLPVDIRLRLEVLIALPAEGGWHPLAIAAQQLHQLHWIDRDWTHDFLLPRFDPARPEAEAAWSGFAHSGYFASRALFQDMRAYFLAAFAATPHWTANGIEDLGQHLLFALDGQDDGKPFVTAEEARTALRGANAAVRLQALWFLPQLVALEDGWERRIVPFFRHVWPRDRQFQTPETTHRLMLFLENLGERFPDGVRLVGNFLVSCPDVDVFLFQLGRDGGDGRPSLARKYPLATLVLLNRIVDKNSPRPPYGLAEVVTSLADASPEIRQDASWQSLHEMTHTKSP